MSDVDRTLETMHLSMANGRQCGKTQAIAQLCMVNGWTFVAANPIQQKLVQGRFPGLKVVHRETLFHPPSPFSREVSMWDHLAIELTAREAVDEIHRVRKMNRELMQETAALKDELLTAEEQIKVLEQKLVEVTRDRAKGRKTKRTAKDTGGKGRKARKKAKRPTRRVRNRNR